MDSYDVLIIGSGPGGYIAAEEAARLGKSVAVIEKQAVGGTCLNVGCMPSKSYLQHSHWLLMVEEANQHGMDIEVKGIDFPALVERKNKVVSTLQKGILGTFKANGIAYIQGEAIYKQGTTFSVNDQLITGKDIILATGGSPFIPPIQGLNDVNFLTTDTFFDMTELPKKLVSIGGGVIAVELCFALRPLGVEVVIIEIAPDILLTEDEDARKVIKKKLKQMGIKVETGVQIKEVSGQKVVLSDGKAYEFDQLLVATGRKANLELPKVMSLQLDEKQKFVSVDEAYQTSEPHIYAIGDITGGYTLAHAASAEGIKAARAIAGQKEKPINQTAVPRSLYTQPEVATFGVTAQEAEAAGYDVIVEQLPFSFNGRAIASAETEGFVKIISEAKYHQILGAVIVGNQATELLHQLLTVYEAEGTVDEVANTIFSHPTVSELTKDVANKIIRHP